MHAKSGLTFVVFTVFSIVKLRGASDEFSGELSKDSSEALKELIHKSPKEASEDNLGDMTKDASELIRKYLKTDEDVEGHKEADDYLEKISPGLVAKMNEDLENMKKLVQESDEDERKSAEEMEEEMENVKSNQENAEDGEGA